MILDLAALEKILNDYKPDEKETPDEKLFIQQLKAILCHTPSSSSSSSLATQEELENQQILKILNLFFEYKNQLQAQEEVSRFPRMSTRNFNETFQKLCASLGWSADLLSSMKKSHSKETLIKAMCNLLIDKIEKFSSKLVLLRDANRSTPDEKKLNAMILRLEKLKKNVEENLRSHSNDFAKYEGIAFQLKELTDQLAGSAFKFALLSFDMAKNIGDFFDDKTRFEILKVSRNIRQTFWTPQLSANHFLACLLDPSPRNIGHITRYLEYPLSHGTHIALVEGVARNKYKGKVKMTPLEYVISAGFCSLTQSILATIPSALRARVCENAEAKVRAENYLDLYRSIASSYKEQYDMWENFASQDERRESKYCLWSGEDERNYDQCKQRCEKSLQKLIETCHQLPVIMRELFEISPTYGNDKFRKYNRLSRFSSALPDARFLETCCEVGNAKTMREHVLPNLLTNSRTTFIVKDTYDSSDFLMLHYAITHFYINVPSKMLTIIKEASLKPEEAGENKRSIKR